MRFNREKDAITNYDEAFRRGLQKDSPMYDDLTKYPCKIMDDVQAKAMAHMRLEENKRKLDDKYYYPNRKVTMPRVRDYKPFTRNGKKEYKVNALNDRVDWRKDPNLPPTYDTYCFMIPPSILVREFNKLGV